MVVPQTQDQSSFPAPPDMSGEGGCSIVDAALCAGSALTALSAPGKPQVNLNEDIACQVQSDLEHGYANFPILQARVQALRLQDAMLERISAHLAQHAPQENSRTSRVHAIYREEISSHVLTAWKELFALEDLLTAQIYGTRSVSAYENVQHEAQSILRGIRSHRHGINNHGAGVPAGTAQEILKEFKTLEECAGSMYHSYLNSASALRAAKFSEIKPGDVLIQEGVSSIVLGAHKGVRYPFLAPVVSIFADGRRTTENLNLAALVESGMLRFIERSSAPHLTYAVETKREPGPVPWGSLCAGDMVQFSYPNLCTTRRLEVLNTTSGSGPVSLSYIISDESSGAVRFVRKDTHAQDALVSDPFAPQESCSFVTVTRRTPVAYNSPAPAGQTLTQITIAGSFAAKPHETELREVPQCLPSSVSPKLSNSEFRAALLLQLDIVLGWQGAPELHSEPFLVIRENLRKRICERFDHSCKEDGLAPQDLLSAREVAAYEPVIGKYALEAIGKLSNMALGDAQIPLGAACVKQDNFIPRSERDFQIGDTVNLKNGINGLVMFCDDATALVAIKGEDGAWKTTSLSLAELLSRCSEIARSAPPSPFKREGEAIVVPHRSFAHIEPGDEIHHSDGSKEIILELSGKNVDEQRLVKSLLLVGSNSISMTQHERRHLGFYRSDKPVVVRYIESSAASSLNVAAAGSGTRAGLIDWSLLPAEKKELQHDNLRQVDQLIGLLSAAFDDFLLASSDYLAQRRVFSRMLWEHAGGTHHAVSAESKSFPDLRFESLAKLKQNYHDYVNEFRRAFEGLCLYAERMPENNKIASAEPAQQQDIQLSLAAALEEVISRIQQHLALLKEEAAGQFDRGSVRAQAYQKSAESLSGIREIVRETMSSVAADAYVLDRLHLSHNALIPGYDVLQKKSARQGAVVIENALTPELCRAFADITALFYNPQSIAEQGVIVSRHPPEKFEAYGQKGAKFLSYRENDKVMGYIIAFPPDKVGNIAPEVYSRYRSRGDLWYLHLAVVHPEAQGAHRFLHNAWRLLASGTADGAVARVHVENKRSWRAHLIAQGWEIVSPDSTKFFPRADSERGATFIGMYLDFKTGCPLRQAERRLLFENVTHGRLVGAVHSKTGVR